MLTDLQSDSDPQRWTLPGLCGPEQWQRTKGAFTSVLVGQKRLVVANRPFDLDQLGLRPAACGHAGPWPSAFRYCPECGTQLPEPRPLPPPASWMPPFGAPNGLSVLPTALSPLVDTRREEAMPPSASLSFIVAGLVPHLFAYDTQTGWLRVRNEDTVEWQDLLRLPAAQVLPRWSWSAGVVTGADAGAVEGFALPTDQGPVFVRTGTLTSLHEVRAPASLGIQSAAGGVACLRGRPFVPVCLAGGLGLARLSAGGDTWELVAVTHGEAVPPRTVFAAPVTHDDDAFWCTLGGQLSLSLTGAGGVQAAWQAWPEGLTPLLGIRPLQEPNGVLHHLMRLGEDQLVFRTLKLPGTPAEQRPASGLWLSAGNAAFREGRRRRIPWDDAVGRAEYTVPDGEFLLPLLAFGDRRFLLASCAGRSTLTAFVDTQAAPPERRACNLVFTAATRSLEPLQRRIDARSAWDIVPFVFRDRLYVYAANANQCWSWALRADATS